MDKRISRALTFEEMRDAALKGERGNFNLDQAIQAMLEYKERGESVSYRFNGFKLESDEISADGIEKVHEEYGKALSTKLPRELYAEEMRDAALKGERGNFNLEQAAQAMLEYKTKGESVYYVFNGFELNSDEVTTVEETLEKYDRFLRRDRESKPAIESDVENEKIDSEVIMPIDESKFAKIYSKAKGRIKEVFSKIKSFINIKSNDKNDKTNDENIK